MASPQASAHQELNRTSPYRTAIVVGLVILVIDQLTKTWAKSAFADEPPREIIGSWLRFTYGENPGAAFSIFTGSGRVIALVAIGVIAFLLYLVGRSSHGGEVVALGLILGGALGNLSDRIFRGDGFLDGAVIDWIDWWFIPTFNVADAALNVGVAVLLLATLVVARRQ